MKLRDHYDWVVLGDHPGALLSAGLAARLGLSVLVLSAFPGRSLKIAEDGRFVDPEPNYLLSLGRVPRFSGLLSECLSRLGILPAELEQIGLADALPEVLTPGIRLELGPDDARLERALLRELGKGPSHKSGLTQALKRTEADYLSYWLQLPERLTLSPDKKRKTVPTSRVHHIQDVRRKIAKDASGPTLSRWVGHASRASVLERELKFEGLAETLEGMWFGVSGAAMSDPRLDELLHMLVLARTGASFRGGMASYREFLLRIAGRLGAHVPPQLECRRVFVDKGRFTGVQVANRANVVSAGGAVAGCALSQLSTLISVGGRNWWKRLKESPEPLGWKMTVSFTVDQAALPPGVCSRVIWQEGEAPPIEVEVSDPAVGGGTGRRADQRVVLARTVMPFTAESLTLSYQRSVASRMLRQLTEIFPFFERHLVATYPEFRGSKPGQTDRELAEVYGFERLEAIPENLRCLAPIKGTGVGSRSGIEGLFVATGESFPELGSFGGTVAALESVSWLAHRGGLAGPFA